MTDEFSILRSLWQRRDYDRTREFLIGKSLESLDIEQLTLLEYASYEYQDLMETRQSQGLLRPEEKGFRFREEAFRSELRTQRREKLEALVRGIVEGSRNIYGICSGSEDPQFLLNCMLRLSYQYDNTRSLIGSPAIEPDLLSGAFSAIEALLKNPSQETEDSFRTAIGNIDHEKARSALQDAMIYMSESSLKIRRQAIEFVAKCLLYEANKGCVADLIVSVYKGRQESPIVKVSNEDWKDIVRDAKRACFRHLNRESELDTYALSVYLNDYPGTRETKVTEYPYKGKSIGLALLAHFKNHKLRSDLAFTGGIGSDSGLVSAVQGFDGTGKAYAACWNGIEKIIVPAENVEDAEREIEQAHEDGAKCKSIVVGVTTLSDAEEAAFQSVISPEFDEIVIKKFAFPIARKYHQIPHGLGQRKERYVYQALTNSLQYLSLILISQYVIRDADREEIRNSELTGWLYEELGSKMVSGTWGTIFLKILKHYIEIQERNPSALFVTELYDISGDAYDRIRKTIDSTMAMRHNYSDGNLPTTTGEWQELISKYTETLEAVLGTFSFIADYDLIRVVDRQDDHYFHHRYMGIQADQKTYKRNYPLAQELIPGQIYLAKRDYTDLLHLHPLLIFWNPSPDVTIYDVMMYYESSGKEAKYQQSFKTGFFDSPAHLHEIDAIYDKLRREKDRRPSFEDLKWERLRGIVREVSNIRDFDSGIYFQRSNVIESLHRFVESDKTCMIISGNAGSGKTSFLGSLSEAFSDDSDVCVLVYPARGLRGRNLDEMLSDALIQDDEGDKKGFIARMARTQILDGRKFIVCIDAINEHNNPKELLESLDRTVEKNRYPWFKLVITCRTNVWKRLAPPTVYLTESRYYRHGENRDLAVYLQEFGTDEIPQVYERYRIRYELQTPYDELGHSIQRLARDPLVLLLIAESYRGEAIPGLGFSINSTYLKYINRLEKSGRLMRDKDQNFLTKQLIPLMAEEGNYTNYIDSKQTRERLVSIPGLDDEIPLHELMYSYDEEKLKTPYIRLLDAGILKEEGELTESTISFRIERLYEFFLGEYIQENEIEPLSGQAKLARLQELVDVARAKPYFWGVVRQAILIDEKHRNDILKQLAQTDDRFTRNFIVDCLIVLAKDEGEVDSVCGILAHLTSLKGKSEAVRNSKTVAILVASELCRIPELLELDSREAESLAYILEEAVYDKSGQVRNTACEYIYYLSIGNPGAALRIVESIGKNVKLNWNISRFTKSAMACGTISFLMYCDAFNASIKEQAGAQETIDRLRDIWADIIRNCKRLLIVMLWAGRTFSKHVLGKEVGYVDPFNYYELSHFFNDLSQEERDVFIELTPYLKLERQDTLSVEDIIIEVSRRSDMLSFYQIIYIFTAQASVGNVDDSLRIIERIYQEGSEFSKYLCAWALDSIMRIDNSRIDTYRRLIEGYLDNTDNWWTRSGVIDIKYCPQSLAELIVRHEEAGRSINTETLDRYIGMARGDEESILYIVENMRALALYYDHPSIALDVLKRAISKDMFRPEMLLFNTKPMAEKALKKHKVSERLRNEFENSEFALSQKVVVLPVPSGFLISDEDSKRVYYVEKAKRKLNVYSQTTKRLVQTLVDIKVHHPEAVENFLQSIGKGLSQKEKQTVRTAESSELLGHLFGMVLTSWVANAVARSPNIRNDFADAIAVATRCKNLGVWIDQALRRAANRIVGEDFLKVIPMDEEE